MELYILTADYKRKTVIDVYESLIWTERFNAVGEFELIIDFDFLPRELTIEGTYLGLSDSQRIMVIETTERITADDGTYKVKISGPSLESILHHRMNILLPSYTASAPAETVTFDWPFHTNIYNQVMAVMKTNVPWPQDRLAGLQTGRLNPEGSLPYPEAPYVPPDTLWENGVRMAFKPPSGYIEGSKFVSEVGTLGSTVEGFGLLYGIGYSIVRDGDTGNLYFEFYTGDDHTSGQGDRPAIIFSKAMDNIANTNELRSVNNLKTAAWVFAKNASMLVYANNEKTDASGFDRRIMIVKATDLTDPAGNELTYKMEIRGRAELAKQTRLHALDGEIDIGTYRYNVDYRLGDLVEQRSTSGVTGIFRVVEQVFVSDSEGQRAYPTLQLDLLVTLGAWYSWTFNSYWETYATDYTTQWDTV